MASSTRFSCTYAMALSVVVTTACYDSELCDHIVCAPGGGAAGTGGSAGSGEGGMAEGGAGGGGGGGGDCDPGELAAGTTISPGCGVFVLPGASNGTGTQENPFGTLAEALERVA